MKSLSLVCFFVGILLFSGCAIKPYHFADTPTVRYGEDNNVYYQLRPIDEWVEVDIKPFLIDWHPPVMVHCQIPGRPDVVVTLENCRRLMWFYREKTVYPKKQWERGKKTR